MRQVDAEFALLLGLEVDRDLDGLFLAEAVGEGVDLGDLAGGFKDGTVHEGIAA
jgi:hypothetical protein